MKFIPEKLKRHVQADESRRLIYLMREQRYMNSNQERSRTLKIEKNQEFGQLGRQMVVRVARTNDIAIEEKQANEIVQKMRTSYPIQHPKLAEDFKFPFKRIVFVLSVNALAVYICESLGVKFSPELLSGIGLMAIVTTLVADKIEALRANAKEFERFIENELTKSR